MHLEYRWDAGSAVFRLGGLVDVQRRRRKGVPVTPFASDVCRKAAQAKDPSKIDVFSRLISIAVGNVAYVCRRFIHFTGLSFMVGDFLFFGKNISIKRTKNRSSLIDQYIDFVIEVTAIYICLSPP